MSSWCGMSLEIHAAWTADGRSHVELRLASLLVLHAQFELRTRRLRLCIFFMILTHACEIRFGTDAGPLAQISWVLVPQHSAHSTKPDREPNLPPACVATFGLPLWVARTRADTFSPKPFGPGVGPAVFNIVWAQKV